MYAYEPNLEVGQSAQDQKGRSGVTVDVKKTKTKHLVQTSENIYLIPIAVAEALLLGAFIAMNYVFRFDPAARDGASLADYSKFWPSAGDLVPNRPYYNYSLTLEQNQNSSGGTFGISFTMEEYAFFVPVFLVPILLIVVVELIKHFYPTKHVKNVNSLGFVHPPVVRRMLRFTYTFMLFGTMAGMVTAFIKLLVPVARPHYASVCFEVNMIPNPTTAGFCTNPNIAAVNEALRSFPSYHATIAVYCGAFLCLYLFYMVHFRGVYSASIALSLPLIIMATIGALHRWITYHNTFSDVVWGGVIGLVMALYAVYGMLNRFQERVWKFKPAPDAPPPVQQPQQHTSSGYTNQGFEPTTPLTKTNMAMPPLSREPPQHLPPQQDGGALYCAPTQDPVPSILRPAPTKYSPAGRPTQAFNATFVLEDEYHRPPQTTSTAADHHRPQSSNATDYNRARQRYSVPAPPRGGPLPRPTSAYPGSRPRSRYEGTSYF